MALEAKEKFDELIFEYELGVSQDEKDLIELIQKIRETPKNIK